MIRAQVYNLFSLFLSRLFGWFFALTALLSGVILASHYLITLRFLPAGLVTPSILVLLSPQMIGHAIPVALCMSVGLTAYRLRITHEYFLVLCLLGARRAWRRSLASVLVGSAVLFAFCIGWWGPYYYAKAKREMVASVSRLVRVVPADTLISLSPRLAVWYAMQGEDQEWKDARLYLKTHTKESILAAGHVVLEDDAFILRNGSIYEQGSMHTRYHQFGKMVLPYDLSGVMPTAQLRPKHATLSQLWERRNQRPMVREIVRRCVHVCLVGVVPLILLLLLSVIQVHQFLFVVIASIAGAALMQIFRELVQLVI